MAKNANVNTPNAQWEAMNRRWALPVALLGSTPAMQAAGTTYLPQFDSESSKGYKQRLAASVLFNGYGRTVAVLAGEPLRKPVSIVNGGPAEESIYNDVDLTGRDLNAFAGQLLTDVLTYGKCHFIVAMPNMQALAEDVRRPLTLADFEASGARPYFVRTDPRSVIGWRGDAQSVEALSRLRVRETDVEADGEWAEKTVNYVRVYYPNETVRYREPTDEESKETGGDWIPEDPETNTLGIIPLVTAYADREGLLVAYPTLEDLAWTNLQHWQASSDQFNILHFARTYMLALYGWDKEEAKTVEIGVNKALINKDVAAHAEVVEHSGAAIEAGRQQLVDLIDQMRALGTDMLVPKPNTTATATEATIDKAEMVSELQMIARNVERAIEQGYRLAAKWMNRKLPADFKVNINQQFSPAALSASPLKDLRDLFGLGGITLELLAEEYKRYGVLNPEVNVQQQIIDRAQETELDGEYEEDDILDGEGNAEDVEE